MIIPGAIVVPNSYYLCEKHHYVTLEFDDVYNDDGTRKDIKDLIDDLNKVNESEI